MIQKNIEKIGCSIQKKIQIIAIFVAMISLLGCSPGKFVTEKTSESSHGSDTLSSQIKLQDTMIPLSYENFSSLTNYSYSWVSYRAKAHYSYKGNEGECNLFFVNKTDSIIYLNVNIAGIEIVRFVLTPSEIVYVNKLNKTYYKGGYHFFRMIAGVEITFDMIQAMLNGKDFKNFDFNFIITQTDNQTVLHSHSRKEKSSNLYLIQKMTLNEQDQLIENQITIKSINRKISIYYSDYQPVDSLPFFNQLQLETTDISINLGIRSIKFNTPGPTSITIPDSFRFIDIK